MKEAITKMFLSPDISSLLLAICFLVGWIILNKLIKTFILFCQAEQQMLNPKKQDMMDSSKEERK